MGLGGSGGVHFPRWITSTPCCILTTSNCIKTSVLYSLFHKRISAKTEIIEHRGNRIPVCVAIGNRIPVRVSIGNLEHLLVGTAKMKYDEKNGKQYRENIETKASTIIIITARHASRKKDRHASRKK